MPVMKPKPRTGEAVRIARVVRGLSQTRLAQRVGTSQSKIWQVENNVVEAKPDLWAKIWGALTTDRPDK